MTAAYRATEKVESCDVQSQPDARGIELDQAGVSRLRYPIVVLDRAAREQHTVASVTMSVGVPHHFKGTHMSRFIEILNQHRGEITMNTIPTILSELRARLDADRARMEVRFPYFVEKAAPATQSSALMDYECAFTGELNGSSNDFVLEVQVPVTSLCPCSKAISDYGAHNQRGTITMRIRTVADAAGKPTLVWIEELIDIAERSASAPVYPLLKRIDERFVTMQAYDNPVFVEDMVRAVAGHMLDDARVRWFSVEAVNEESIHNHAAYAKVERWRGTNLSEG